MKKQAKLSRIPAEDETSIGVPMKFLGKPYTVTAPESQMDEISMLWANWKPPMTMLNKNSLSYKTVPKFKRGVRNLMSKNSFMLSMSDEKWVFNWSLAQQTLEINVQAKMSKAKIRRLAAFAFGIMMYDTGLKPKSRIFFNRKIKREKPPLQGIQKYLGFLKDGMALGRPRAAFAFGFMMHLEQVSKKFFGHPLHAMVGEVFFDKNNFAVDEETQYTRFEVDEESPLGYEFDSERFDLVYKGKSESQIAAMKRVTVAGMDYETALDSTGIAPFTNALKKYITNAVTDPQSRKHSEVLRGLGLVQPSQFDPNKFELRLNAGSSSIGFRLTYNGRNCCNGSRSQMTQSTHYNALCEVESPFQGLGAGMHMSAAQIEHAMKTGKKKIKVTAALDGGWRTWNKFGFESNNPVMGIVSGAKSWCEKSVDAKIYEMGNVDRQQVMTDLMVGMVQQLGGASAFGGASTTQTGPVTPVLPSDSSADIAEVLKTVVDTSGAYSGAMQRMLQAAGLPTTTNKRDITTWFAGNTITVAQQQKVHDYFTSGSSGFEDKFRRLRGYPPRAGQSRSNVNTSQMNSEIKGLIESFGWFGGEAFNGTSVLNLIKSPQFDVVFGYDNLPKIVAFFRSKNYEDQVPALTKAKLTPRTQYMQDCMELDGFSKWWSEGGGRSWSGTLNLTDGKYSIAVLAMDHYRKMKVQNKPDVYAEDSAFQRARVASDMTSIIDADILENFVNLPESEECGGGLLRMDVALMEQAVRNARLEKKDMEKGGLVRVASRWLGGE